MTHGVALGAGLMFLLDPRGGGARRAYVRDKSIRASHELENAARVGARDLAHRIEGTVARLLSPEDEEVSEDVLVARVRSRLGHVCTHPHAIEVTPKGDGWIELKGPILADEKQHVLSAIGHVRGVDEIDDDLEVHERADVPALQCEHRPPRQALTRFQTPAARLLFGGGAAALALGSLLLGHPLGFLLGGIGALRVARSIEQRNLPVRRGRSLRGRPAEPERREPERRERGKEEPVMIAASEAGAAESGAPPSDMPASMEPPESVVPT